MNFGRRISRLEEAAASSDRYKARHIFITTSHTVYGKDGRAMGQMWESYASLHNFAEDSKLVRFVFSEEHPKYEPKEGFTAAEVECRAIEAGMVDAEEQGVNPDDIVMEVPACAAI
jgi:hypothetical protein